MVNNTQYRHAKRETLLRINTLISKMMILDLMKIEKIDYRFLQKIEYDLEKCYNWVNPSERYVHQPYISATHHDHTVTDVLKKATLDKIENMNKNKEIKP